MARASLPPGFRFHPTDAELVMYYLKRKVMGEKLSLQAIAEVNIYEFSPWDLPDKSCLRSKDLEWFFFCPREKKYASGAQVKRATDEGFWKTTGKDRPVKNNYRTVGTVKTLVFYLGRAPQAKRTDWVIHEYMIDDDQLATEGLQDTYVLCKVFKKNGLGPKNGAQYGAPFNEADWADDDIDDANTAVSFDRNPTAVVLPEKQSCYAPAGSFDPGNTSVLSLTEGGQSPSAAPSTSKAPIDEELLRNQRGNHQDDFNGKGKIEYLPNDAPNDAGCDIYNGLVDLDCWAQMNEDGLDLSRTWVNGCPNMISQDNSAYIELNDLLTPLSWPGGVTGTGESSLGAVVESYNHQKTELCGSSYPITAQMNEDGLDLSRTWVNGCPNMFPQDNSAYIELNDLLIPLSWPGGVTGTDESSLGAVVESDNHQKTELSGSGYPIKDHQAAGAESYSHQNHHASSSNQLPWFAEGSDLGGNCLDVLHAVQDPFNVGFNDAYELDLDFAHGQPQNGVNFSQDMEIGRYDDNYGFGK